MRVVVCCLGCLGVVRVCWVLVGSESILVMFLCILMIPQVGFLVRKGMCLALFVWLVVCYYV